MVVYADLVAHAPGRCAPNHFVITCSYTNARFGAPVHIFSAKNKFSLEVIPTNLFCKESHAKSSFPRI